MLIFQNIRVASKNKYFRRIKTMETGSAIFATLVYYLVLLMSLLAGNALSVSGGIDLIEPLYKTLHKVHPIAVNVYTYVLTRLQHFKLFKVNHGPKDDIKSSGY